MEYNSNLDYVVDSFLEQELNEDDKVVIESNDLVLCKNTKKKVLIKRISSFDREKEFDILLEQEDRLTNCGYQIWERILNYLDLNPDFKIKNEDLFLLIGFLQIR